MSSLDFITSLTKNISLGNKLLLIILLASNVALFIASTAIIIYDRQTDKATMQQEMRVLGNVIAQRSVAALTFQDVHLAEENLRAFSEKSTVMNACIYASDGSIFAAYRADNVDESCNPVEPNGAVGFIDDFYIEKESIVLDGYVLGSLYVTTRLTDIDRRLMRYIFIVSLIFMATAVITFFMAIKLQKIITRPIDELAAVARKIQHDKSYSLRVEKFTNDEIGQLVDAFNDMLEGIEDRDLMLVDAKKNLEDIVRKRTAELREAQNELIRKDRMATLGQLTAVVSHELRNPLGTIRTSIFTLYNRVNSKDDSIRPIFDRINRNIVRCDSIITELLDFSRIRALQHQKTSLGEWIRRVIEELDIPKGISVSLNLDDSIEVEIDRDLFRRVLVNVIENSQQALMDSGTDKNIIIECRVNATRTEIIVIDTGPGIQKDIMPRIYEPMFSTKAFGIGLGLSIVRQIMLQHGGNVEIDSELGIGTRVVLWLPRQARYVSQDVSLSVSRGT